MNRFFRKTLLLLSVAILSTSCRYLPHNRTAAVLDAVESYINDRPDSALAVLEGVDYTALTTRALRARYSLLRTMAQAKNYLDLTVPGLIDDAAAWYARHGSADEKMKTLYYLGCIAQAKGERNSAAVYYSQAEDYVGKVKDSHTVGLLYIATASVYNGVYNIQKEQEYYEKAVKLFEYTRDPMYDSALGGLALVYHSRQNWAMADSLYNRAITHTESNPHALAVFFSNYARMKLLQPEKDPVGAIELLDRKKGITGGLTPEEVGAYAYASVLVGKTTTADVLIPKLESMIESKPLEVLPWLSRVAIERGDYQKAYHYQTEAHLRESRVIHNALSDSVTQALREAAERKIEKTRQYVKQVASMLGVVCLGLLSIVLIGIMRRRRIKVDLNRLIGIREQLQSELELSERERTGQQDRLVEMEQKVAHEREVYTRERVRRLRQLGELRSTFWWRERGGMKEEEAVKRIKEEIAYVFRMDNNGALLVRRLDRELDGAVSRLRKELHMRGNPREVLFLCCCILDLEPEMIAEIIRTTKANVYEKRSRLRARIRNLQDPLLSVLVEKTNTPLKIG